MVRDEHAGMAFFHGGRNDCKMCLLLTINVNLFTEDSSMSRFLA